MIREFGKNRLDSILESVDAAIITIDIRGRVMDVNTATLKLFGYEETELLGKNVKLLMPKPYREEHDGYIRNYQATGERKIIGLGRRVTGQHKSEKCFPIHLSVAEFEEQGEVYYTGIIHDLTELEQANAASLQLGRIIDESINEVYTFSMDTLLFKMVNKVALNNLGYSIEEISQLTPINIVKSLSREQLLKTLNPILDGLKERVQLAVAIVRKNGTVYEADVQLHLSRTNDPSVFVAIVQDVTENNRMARAIRQTQKMESIGSLTGGVAHDFNNILTVILGNLELLDYELEGADQLELLKEARDAANMGARLTKRLLAFARRSRLTPLTINLNNLILDISEMLCRLLGENVQFTSILEPNLSETLVDISEFENALVNLCINARDAMPTGGTLAIETQNCVLDEETIAGLEIREGQYVKICVTDTGTGVAEDIRDSLFEPFVSTKLGAQGSGLGLSMVYGFVKQSNGHITVYSESGKGTTFTLYLPVVEGATTAPSAEADSSNKVNTQRGKTILLAEDDDSVRKLTIKRLERLGHKVIEAEDGYAALALFNNSDKIDMVLTDVVMTEGMTGYDLAKAVQAINPEIPVLLTSGYADNVINEEKLQESGFMLLRKPYHLGELDESLGLVWGDS